METVSVSLPPPLPPKTRKKPCGGQQLRPFQESGRGPDSIQCRYTDAAPAAVAVAAAHSGAGADRVHVVSIRIRPEEHSGGPGPGPTSTARGASSGACSATGADGCVRISVGGATPPPPATAIMVSRTTTTAVSPSPPDAAAFLFYNGVAMTTSGQASPVDSGTCSDDAADAATPPPLPRKASAARLLSAVRVTVNNNAAAGPEDRFHSDPEDERCSSTMSCDSLNSLHKVACFLDDHRNLHGAAPDVSKLSLSPTASPPAAASSTDTSLDSVEAASVVRRKLAVDERTYEDRRGGCGSSASSGLATPPDHYYDFHLNERDANEAAEEEDTFAGCRDYTLDEPVTVPATIKSSKGTVRGVRNRVRAGVATFLSIQHNRVSTLC
ncbi:Glutaredoxin domain-containing cysteine-rich protein [Frankliniella fusca]|uniref:Glutaredoxin domain-containing cysteine-rich protein n=1 Tax=Frankliniella fusca TaxID=407009 RepID=A0AAE1HYY1_9NEOP|nr:Glutaredoxin domain-containing cysteine-rich protein [Frankliniella fusca]